MLSLILIVIVLLIAVIAASALALSSPAEARPRQHQHHATSVDTDRVAVARRYIGQTARQLGLPRHLWCADFQNLVERRLGRRGTGSRRASSFARYGRPVRGPAVGSIAVMHRRGGGHVGVVTGTTSEGVVVISGNHAGAVREAVYPPSRIYAYRD